jgi:hypothetical protein
MTHEKIKRCFLEKMKGGETWENEFGSCNKKHPLKTEFKHEKDFKIDCIETNGKRGFKIVPSYFSFPGGQYYWHYLDGFIENERIEFL